MNNFEGIGETSDSEQLEESKEDVQQAAEQSYEEKMDEARQQHVMELAREQALKDQDRIKELEREIAEIKGNTPEKQQREAGMQKREEIFKRLTGRDESYDDIKGEISPELLSDKNFILEALRNNNIGVLEDMSEELKSDRNFIQEAIKVNSTSFEKVSEELQNDEEFALEALKRNGSLVHIGDFKKVFGENKNFILKAREIIGDEAVELIGEDLKNDKELLLQFADTGMDTLRHASNELLGDKEFVLKIIESTSNNTSEEGMDAVPPVFFKLESCLKLLPELLKNEPGFREEVDRIIIDTMKGDPDEELSPIRRGRHLTRLEVYKEFLEQLWSSY